MSIQKVKRVVVDGIVRAKAESISVWPGSDFVIRYKDREVCFHVLFVEEEEAHCRVVGDCPPKWKIAAA